ncbi:MAG: LysM peptidoglycan-binding domain-containing M23 family metallopeptidase [Aestuariivirga sp.]|nr:LysM peptidoglycan-binding domain-containing M23 family metallopeptidase [Aestuariivirga sp.]
MRIDSSAPKGLSKFNILASAALAVMLAACSNSVERFADNASTENPSDVDPVYTASVPKKRTTFAPSYESSGDDKIVSRPLASAPLGSPNYAGNNYTYKKPAYKQPAYSEPMAVESARNTTSIPKGGTVRVEQGMTLYSISRANGLTVAQLAAANGIAPPYTVSTGRVLRIPGVAQARAPKPSFTPQDEFVSNEPAKKASGGRHTVAGGETLFSLGRKYRVSPYAIADLNGLSHDQSLSIGQSLRVPGGKSKPIVSKVPATGESEQIASNDDPVETDDTEQSLTLKKPALDQEVPIAKPVQQQTAAVDAAPAMGSMRWPVKGKIISEYGAKPNGLKNEGINIAVPEGTGVRAAESGVVAYAGNELKGYGNLVLIRHEGGWVTAYAHAKELFVKRGDIVKRGDVIAKAGQTGSVSSPQLHFEVRKGATAMDPLKFLASTTASN